MCINLTHCFYLPLSYFPSLPLSLPFLQSAESHQLYQPNSFSLSPSSAESHHHAPASHRKTSIQTETTDAKGQWQAIKLAIGDSQKFRDLILGLHWKEGLTIEAVNLIKSHLATTPTGRQKPRESDSNSAHSQTQQTLVTLTAAKHAAEVVEVMCGFAVAMVDYTAVYKTHRLAANELRRLALSLPLPRSYPLLPSPLPS